MFDTIQDTNKVAILKTTSYRIPEIQEEFRRDVIISEETRGPVKNWIFWVISWESLDEVPRKIPARFSDWIHGQTLRKMFKEINGEGYFLKRFWENF